MGRIQQQRPGFLTWAVWVEQRRTWHSSGSKHSHWACLTPSRPHPQGQGASAGPPFRPRQSSIHQERVQGLPPCPHTQQVRPRKGWADEISFHWALQVKKLASNLHARRAGVTGRPLHNHHHTDARTTKDSMAAGFFSCKLAIKCAPCPFILLQYPAWAHATKLLKPPPGHVYPGRSQILSQTPLSRTLPLLGLVQPHFLATKACSGQSSGPLLCAPPTVPVC